MTLAEINAAGFAWMSTDIKLDVCHFDCGGGERYTLPRGAVFAADLLPGYKRWVARLDHVRAAHV